MFRKKHMSICQICNYTMVEIDYPFGAQERLLICAAAERRLQRDREVEHPRRLASRRVSPRLPELIEPPTNGVVTKARTSQHDRIYSFLAQANTIEIFIKGLFDFLSMLDFRHRFLNIRIARELLQQCPFLFVSGLLLWFASD
jgi:hypothetical protein